MANEKKTDGIKVTTFENTKLNVVPLNWKEVYYTNCPLISASNVDQELGWTREEYKKLGYNMIIFATGVRQTGTPTTFTTWTTSSALAVCFPRFTFMPTYAGQSSWE